MTGLSMSWQKFKAIDNRDFRFLFGKKEPRLKIKDLVAKWVHSVSGYVCMKDLSPN